MPLYLVRWASLEASIVRADNEAHLTNILDEEDSPASANWTQYEGPLWIDVKLGIDAQRDEESGDWRVSVKEGVSGDECFGARVELSDSETGVEMLAAVVRQAFPNLGDLLEKGEREGADAGQIRAVALRDLEQHQPSGIPPASFAKLLAESDEE